jgi:diguanylate cyclase (GGDEF)-like protein
MNTSLDLLRKIDMLSPLDNNELEQIYSRMKTVVKKKGESLFMEGDNGDEMYIVVNGKVSITVSTPDGSRVEIAVITEGNFFGEMSIFENAPRSATCSTKEETTLLEFSKTDFFNLMDNSPTTAIKIMHRMLTTATVRLQNTGAFLSDMVTWGEKARKRAVTDEFTGLYNRRFLDDALEDKFAQAEFNKKPLSLVMVDLDNFGKLNKAYGEAVGDKVLLSALPVFKSVFRDGDILARYGGDEFTFILPDTTPVTALELCRKAVEELRKITILEKMNGAIKKVTASIGVASYPAHADTLVKLKEKTDKALYDAKEKGRDMAVLFSNKKSFFNSRKKRIATIAEKNRIVGNIIDVIEKKDSFLLVGHQNPDEDCIASMVAFSLLLSKLSKTACPIIYREVHHKFPYLLNICRYNSIRFIESAKEIPEKFEAILVFDTPKPSMLEGGEKVRSMIADPGIIKIEFDHHLEADSGYIGDADYCLVDEASSTCELIGYFALKLNAKKTFLEKYQMPDLFSRNFVLSVMTGMISDSKMGKYLKSNRERWFYNFFSTLFNDLLVKKTNASTGNFSTMGDIFNELERLSDEEDECYKYFIKRKRRSEHIEYVIISSDDADFLFSLYEQELIITVARYTANVLAEDSGYLSLVVYYDRSDKSNLIQFRMRRSEKYQKIDLRKVIEVLKIENGGGHPGAVGFRVDRDSIPDIKDYTENIISKTEDLIKKTF